MDLEKRAARPQGTFGGYASYDEGGQAAQTRAFDADEQRVLERNLLMQEYESDRDVILKEIKTALRERRYRDAQEFVYRYRIAAKTDETFAALARMTAEGLENARNIETLETMLDATPEDEYRRRLQLCREILEISPDHPKYVAELRRCEEKLGIGVPAPPLPPPKSESTYTTGCAVLFGFILFCNIFAGLGYVALYGAGGLGVGAITVLLYWLLSSKPSAPFRNLHGFVRGFICFWVWVFLMGMWAAFLA